MSTRLAEGLMAGLLVLLSITLMVKSAELNIGWIEGRGPGSGFWPFWLSALMGIAASVALLRWFARMTPESRSNAPYIDGDTVLLVLITAGALTLMIALIQLIGMYLSFLIFLIFYLRVIGRHGWLETGTFALGVPITVYLLFEVALTRYLPKGIDFFEEAFLVVDNQRYAIQYGAAPGLTAAGIALYVIAAIVVGIVAARMGRNGLVAFWASALLTPVGGAVLLSRHVIPPAPGSAAGASTDSEAQP